MKSTKRITVQPNYLRILGIVPVCPRCEREMEPQGDGFACGRCKQADEDGTTEAARSERAQEARSFRRGMR